MLKEGLGVNVDRQKAKYYLLESYKHGFKKSGLLLREMRYEEQERLQKKENLGFKIKISDLGFSIDIQSSWVELESKNKSCFDAIAIDTFDNDVIFNIKMQVFLIELPDNMAGCVNLDRVANNMGWMTFFIKRSPVSELWHVLHDQVVHVALRQPREDKFRLAALLIVLWLSSARPAEMSTRRACP